MKTESQLASQRSVLKKSIRLLYAKNRLRLLQNKYDSLVIKTLYKKNSELHQEIVKELKPDYEKMMTGKNEIFEEIERMKSTGRWFKISKSEKRRREGLKRAKFNLTAK